MQPLLSHVSSTFQSLFFLRYTQYSETKQGAIPTKDMGMDKVMITKDYPMMIECSFTPIELQLVTWKLRTQDLGHSSIYMIKNKV